MMLSRFSDFKNTENVNPLDLVETLEYKDLILDAIKVINSWTYNLIHTQLFNSEDCDFKGKGCKFNVFESEHICLVFHSVELDNYLYIFLQEPLKLHPIINFFYGYFVTNKDLKKRIKNHPSFMAKNVEGLKKLVE